MLFPVHAPILDTQHLTLATARFKRTDETVVHRCSDVPVIGAVHLRARSEQRSLLLQTDSPIAFRFLRHFDVDAESMERRRGQIRRILEAAPVDRRSQRCQRAVRGRDLSPFAIDRFEPEDLTRLFEHANRQIAALS